MPCVRPGDKQPEISSTLPKFDVPATYVLYSLDGSLMRGSLMRICLAQIRM